MISGARDMNYKADELEDAGGDEALIGTYERKCTNAVDGSEAV